MPAYKYSYGVSDPGLRLLCANEMALYDQNSIVGY
jgi:hypothetical protein